MIPYAVISNPASGNGRGSKVTAELVEILASEGVEFTLHATSGPGDATKMAQEAIGRCRTVLVVGGDGTVNETAQALAHTDTSLAVFRAGSGDDFAKALGMPGSAKEAFEVLRGGKTRTIDLGRMNGRYFVNAVGMGLDAAVNEETLKIKRLRGMPAYFLALMKTLWSFAPPSLEVEADGKELQGRALLFTAGNGTTVGGGFKLTPNARLDDGMLDLTFVEPMKTSVLFWHLPKVFTGAIERVSYATMLRAKSISVHSTEPVPAHVDGEVITPREKDFRIKIVPQALRVVVPEE